MSHSKVLSLLTAQNLLLGAGIGILATHSNGESRYMAIGTVFTLAGIVIWGLNGKGIRQFLKDSLEEETDNV
ncbi:MAG: hypothetical protein AB4040_19820 [Synechococcus sp.]